MSEERADQPEIPAGPAATVVAVLGRGPVGAHEPIVRADDLGLTRGDGCFEGCRLLDGVVMKLDAHLARMTRSAAALDIGFDERAWRELVATVVSGWPSTGEAALKLVLTRGGIDGRPTGFAIVSPLAPEILDQRRDGVRAICLDRGLPSAAFTDAPWLLGGVKTLSYAINMAAAREAARRGVDEIVFVSADRFALETPTGSLVWAFGDTLHTTPTGATGILAGTTQQLLFERAAEAGMRTAQTLLPARDLHTADAVWVVSSVRGPVQLAELDGAALPAAPGLDADIKRLSGF